MIVMANRAEAERRLCFENLTYKYKSCLQVYVFTRIIIVVVESVSDFFTNST